MDMKDALFTKLAAYLYQNTSDMTDSEVALELRRMSRYALIAANIFYEVQLENLKKTNSEANKL